MILLKELNIYIGKRIKEHREKSKITQEHMAKELDIAPNHYGRIERGENACTMDNFIHICNLLCTTPNEIVGGLVITAEDKIKTDIDRLNLEDRLVISKMAEFLLSKYEN